MRRVWLCAAGMLAVVGCRDEAAKPAHETIVAVEQVRELASEAAADSGSPNLVVGLDGTVVLSWIEPVGDGAHAVRMRRLAQGQWSAPATVRQSDALFVNWADFPAVTTDTRGHLVATWLAYHGADKKSYGIQWARSTDAGATWSDAADLPKHRGGPEYGFVSFASTPDLELAAFWLDGRASQGHAGGQMQLRTAVIDDDGSVGEERLVDDRVCDCCQTAAAATNAGPVVVYRDRTDDEIRDIRLAGPGADEQRSVADDAWRIAGCPVNGPAVAASGDRLAVAWFTASADAPKVQVAFAPLHGAFESPTRVDLGQPVGRVDLEWIDADHVVVSFLERAADGDGADLVVRRVATNGSIGPAASVARTSAAPASGFPRMAKIDDRLLVAWTSIETNAPARVRLAELPTSAVPF